MLPKLCFMDQLKNGYMELLIGFGANIQNSTKRITPLTEINLSRTVNILMMVSVIYGIRNTLYHPPKFLVL